MSTGAGGTAPGWYADPSGRFEHRWWDGQRWTDDVSTGGVAGKDQPQPPPQAIGAGHWSGLTADPVAAPMLDAASFAIDFTDGGMGGDGTWRVHDPAGGYLGAMRIRRPRFGSPKQRHLVEDAQGRLLFSLDAPTGSNDLLVHDPTGLVVGRLDLTRTGLGLWAPRPDPSAGPGRWGEVVVQGMGGFGSGEDLVSTGADIISSTGQQVGHVSIAEQRRGLLASGPPGPSWFRVDRDPAMPDPMRALVLVTPIGISCAIDGVRRRGRQARQ